MLPCNDFQRSDKLIFVGSLREREAGARAMEFQRKPADYDGLEVLQTKRLKQ